MAQPKTFVPPIYWQMRPNHAGHKVLVAPLIDASSGITIPGLIMRLEVKSPVVVDACLMQYSLMLQTSHTAPRVYQLEICPAQKRSHMDATQTLYGPHEHIGDQTFGVKHAGIDCSNWAYGLNWFLQRCKITPGCPVPAP